MLLTEVPCTPVKLPAMTRSPFGIVMAVYTAAEVPVTVTVVLSCSEHCAATGCASSALKIETARERIFMASGQVDRVGGPRRWLRSARKIPSTRFCARKTIVVVIWRDLGEQSKSLLRQCGGPG